MTIDGTTTGDRFLLSRVLDWMAKSAMPSISDYLTGFSLLGFSTTPFLSTIYKVLL